MLTSRLLQRTGGFKNSWFTNAITESIWSQIKTGPIFGRPLPANSDTLGKFGGRCEDHLRALHKEGWFKIFQLPSGAICHARNWAPPTDAAELDFDAAFLSN
jgi:hypothetical protein